ncbi:flagellar basal body-associated FliL family protein [Paenibacillus campi]|uniref:flagellar basal body-associated FliL family protein n=1 Tax=Paenibacillus campi TaxID=3106031 RepID=UPI002AFEE323|nr:MULTISPECIES: flagellar basal body-associated FliL family protein [unclassified Paenibacillus]
MKKLLPWLISGVLALGLIGVVAYFLLFGNLFGNKQPMTAAEVAAAEKAKLASMSASEIAEVSSSITDLTTNLGDPSYVVKISFSFQLADKDAKANFDLIKDLKVKPIIIRTLADTQPDALRSADGIQQLDAKLMKLINSSLPEESGKVVDVEVSDRIISSL